MTCKIGNGVFVPDDVGNPVEQTTTLKLEVSVRLDKNKEQDKIISQEGRDYAITYLQGRAVKPPFFPSTIKEQFKFDCTITDAVTGTPMTGKFLITSLLQSKWKPATKTLGTRFEGYFILNS